MRLRCARCNQPLTIECRLGTDADYKHDAARKAPVDQGVIARLSKEETVTPIYDSSGAYATRVVSPTEALACNPADVLKDAIISSGTDNGCCGSDGCDGPNRSCSQCGAVLGTEWSDCWTQAEIRFNPEAVVVEGFPPNPA